MEYGWGAPTGRDHASRLEMGVTNGPSRQQSIVLFKTLVRPLGFRGHCRRFLYAALAWGQGQYRDPAGATVRRCLGTWPFQKPTRRSSIVTLVAKASYAVLRFKLAHADVFMVADAVWRNFTRDPGPCKDPTPT